MIFSIMAIADALTIEEIIPELLAQISQINLLVKGLGIFTLIWIAYNAVLFVMERRKIKRIERIEQKIDKLLKKK